MPWPGPLAGNIMADLGADVIKVEKPDGGADARHWGASLCSGWREESLHPFTEPQEAGVTLGLKSPEGVEKLHFLCADADILIQTLRPGLVEKQGEDGEPMLALFPGLI